MEAQEEINASELGLVQSGCVVDWMSIPVPSSKASSEGSSREVEGRAEACGGWFKDAISSFQDFKGAPGILKWLYYPSVLEQKDFMVETYS